MSQGAAKQGFAQAAETAVGVACLTLQGDTTSRTSERATVKLVAALNSEGVCPGDPSLLVFVER